ncbi:hypothetical protein TrRE_jg8839, partial [Triparma retinervis]
MVFSGFPARAVFPSTPVRVLRQFIGGATKGDRGMWPGEVDNRDVHVECNGVAVDEETGVGSIVKLAKEEHNEVRVVLGRGRDRRRVPWVGRDDE